MLLFQFSLLAKCCFVLETICIGTGETSLKVICLIEADYEGEEKKLEIEKWETDGLSQTFGKVGSSLLFEKLSGAGFEKLEYSTFLIV